MRSRVEPEPGFIFWTRSRIRLWVFESKPDSDPDFSLNLKPKNYISLLLSMIEKRNIYIGSGTASNPDPERIRIVEFVDKQESKSLEPERIRSQFFVTPPISASYAPLH